MSKLTAIFTTALLGSLLLVLSGCGPEPVPLEPIAFPATWGEYAKVVALDGQDALDEFDRQHKKRVPIRQGDKAWYKAEGSDFEIWIGSGKHEKDALKMLAEMTNKISIAPEKIFTKPQPVTIDGVDFFRTDGQEKVNFYYHKGHRVYWIAIQGNSDPQALVRRIYPDF